MLVGGGGGNGVVVLVECSQLWCSASKLQKVFLRIARVTPFFSQLQDVSGVGGISVSCTVSDISDCPRTRSGGGGVIIMFPCPALPCPVFTTQRQLSFTVRLVSG